jgi:UDP-N-acetylmuramoyl-tripeptide--D-alanyl-D-alanine ligase
VVTTSLAGNAADYAGRVADVLSGELIVTERATGAVCTLCSKLPGRHNAANMLLAAAAARALDVPWEAIRSGAARVSLPPMRWERIEAGDRMVINDAYNANSMGMACALETFRAWPAPGRRVLVLGDMRELGVAAEELHRAVGRLLAGGPFQALVTVGACARWIADEAVAAGFPAAQVHGYADAADAAVEAGVWSRPGDTILLKGSRGMALERVAAALTAQEQAAP